MARFFYKCLGRFALMSAAALWAACDSGNKENKPAEQTQTMAEQPNPSRNVVENEMDSVKALSAGTEFFESTEFQADGIFIYVKRSSKEAVDDSSKTITQIKQILKKNASRITKLHKQVSSKNGAKVTYKYHVQLDKKGMVKDVTIVSSKTALDEQTAEIKIQKLLKKVLVLQSPLKLESIDISVYVSNAYTHYDFGETEACLYGCCSPDCKGSIATKVRGYVATTATDLVFFADSSLSRDSLLKEIRKRFPGLRHIYNMFLKKKPGFDGSLVILVSIRPDGTVSKGMVKSSTTGYREFDEEILMAVKRWHFPKSNGFTTVSFPASFTEQNPYENP